MKTKAVFYIFMILFLMVSCSEPVTRVACVGDSITAGSGLLSASTSAYPVVLDQLLGPEYTVYNFGRGGATMLRDGNLPYWSTKEFSNVFISKPDIIIIKLGTNDTKSQHWDQTKFLASYQAMIDTFQTLTSIPKIYVCLPVPSHIDRWGISDSTIVAGVIPVVKQIAEDNNLETIDLYEVMIDHPEYFPDGIHPDEEGARIMAEAVFQEINEE